MVCVSKYYLGVDFVNKFVLFYSFNGSKRTDRHKDGGWYFAMVGGECAQSRFCWVGFFLKIKQRFKVKLTLQLSNAHENSKIIYATLISYFVSLSNIIAQSRRLLENII